MRIKATEATEAKNRFGSICAQAKREPVFVEKAEFEAEFGDWIAAEKARVETRGIPGADLRPW